MAVPFSTEGEDVIKRDVDLERGIVKLNSTDRLEFFELMRCSEWIKHGNFTKVALQFPDELLCSSAEVAKYLHQETSADVFILADTSYGSCCIDEVSAAHYEAQAIIHFGHSCLSPSGRLPVLYIFGKCKLDPEDFLQHMTNTFSACSKLMMVFSVEYYNSRSGVIEGLKKFDQVVIPEILPPNETVSNGTDTLFELFGRQFKLPSDMNIKDYIVVYIGQDSMLLTNMMLTFSQSIYYKYDPVEKMLMKQEYNTNKLLMKRFYMVEKVKDAQIVGILIATLSVSRYMDILSRLKRLLQYSGKKYYIFSVGKINVPKLANFPDVDVFVLVSCPESVMLDSSDYLCPIVTPYEVELACNPGRQWESKLVLDYASLLPGGRNHCELDEMQKTEDTDVSLITGRVRQLGTDDTAGAVLCDTVVVRDPMALSAITGERFANKSWQGLDPQLGQTEVTKAIQGLKGIAMQYEEEPT